MKKSYIMKTIVVILLVIFTVLLAGCTYGDDYIYSSLSVSEDGQTILVKSPDESETRQYLYVGMASGAALYGEKMVYDSYLYYGDGSIGDVFSPVEDGSLLYVLVNGDIYCYVEKNAGETLSDIEKFLGGDAFRVTFADTMYMKECVLNSSETVKFFATPQESALVEVDVRGLKGALLYDVLAYDTYYVLAEKRGAIFSVDDGYLFVDFSTLDNSAFDANGDLSYRKGVIVAERLEGEKLTLLETLRGRTKRMVDETVYEDGLYVGEEVQVEESLSVTIVVTLIFTLIVPTIPVIYIVRYLLRRRRLLADGTGKPSPFPIPLIVMAVGGAMWLLTGITIACIFAFI